MKKILFIISLFCVFTTFAFGQKNAEENPLQNTENTQNSPLKILYKPKAVRKDGQDCSQGTINLRVEFLDSGEIGKISLVNGLSISNNESAIEAAKKIKFQPARKDGKPVTVTKIVQYSFSLY